MEMEQNCGNCEYWDAESPFDGMPRCHIPVKKMVIPYWLERFVFHVPRDIQKSFYGTNCQTFVMKSSLSKGEHQ